MRPLPAVHGSWGVAEEVLATPCLLWGPLDPVYQGHSVGLNPVLAVNGPRWLSATGGFSGSS